MMNATRSNSGGCEQAPKLADWLTTKQGQATHDIIPSNGILRRAARAGRATLSLFVGVTMVWGTMLVSTQPASAQGFRILIPSIATQGVGGVGEEPAGCGLNQQEEVLAELVENDPGQQRNNPMCNATLAQVARARARDMALRGYFSHTNPDGDGPNLLAREAGYPLPDWYSSDQDANNIESIGGGYESAGAVWQGWLGSQKHRTHVLGTQSFYASQTAYGVGYYYNPDSPLKHYWVYLSAPLAE